MPEIFRNQVVDRHRRVLLEAVSLEEPDELDAQQLAETADRFGLGEVHGVQTTPTIACRLCGCTEDRACVDLRDGGGCHWVNDSDLCSKCAGPLGAE